MSTHNTCLRGEKKNFLGGGVGGNINLVLCIMNIPLILKSLSASLVYPSLSLVVSIGKYILYLDRLGVAFLPHIYP